jgi:hypothetical protein
VTAPTIPANVSHQALNYGLGQPHSEWEPRSPHVIVVVISLILGIALIPVGFGIWLLWHVFRTPTMSKKRAARRIYLYDNGFVLAEDPDSPEVWRWIDIDTIYKRIVTGRYEENYSYQLTSTDGRTVKLDWFWDEVGELGYIISIKAACAQLPRMRELLATGREVTFGRIGVSTAGLRDGSKTVPWSDVQRVDLPNRSFSVLVNGRISAFAYTPVDQIPNLRLLEMVITDLRSGHVTLEGDVAYS